MERGRRRRRGKQHVNTHTLPSVDRLSALPDDIIHHILSFLPTKLSVSTSILAERWRLLWAHVPSLDFDSRSHHSMTPLSGIISNFMSVQYKAPNLNTFHLCYGYELRQHRKKEQPVVETWIANATERNVEVLHLRLRYELPQCLFTCKTLVDLTLDSCTCKDMLPVHISWPSLKKLHLWNFEFRKFDEDIPRLLCGCPVLEEFIILLSYGMDIADGGDKSDFSWPGLKRLVYFMFDDNGSVVYPGVKRNAPALRYLQLHDDHYNYNVSISRKDSLTEADICLCEDEYAFDKDSELQDLPHVEFLVCLNNNVKRLKLSGFYHDKIISIASPETTIKFDHLTKLEIRMDGVDCGFIVKFLEIADNLEVLIVDVKRIKNWIEPKQVPPCLLLHLSYVRIEQVTFTEFEFYMVRYLLKNAQVLERMEISPMQGKSDFEANSDALKKISLFERGSKACQLAFC